MGLLSDDQLTRYRVPLLAIACLQAFFTSGIFYGWASLYTLFLEAGVYVELCEGTGETVCSAQKEQLTFIYTVASSVNLLSQLPWGLVLDFLGPRVCNMWSTLLVMCGFILLSLSAQGVLDAYMLAMCLIGGGGPGAQISLFHLSELFPPRQKSSVLSVVTGAFQMGFVVFLGFRTAHQYANLSLHSLALLYCVPLGALLLLGGALWPDAPCIPPGDLDPLSFTSRRPSFPGGVPTQSGKGVVAYDNIGVHGRGRRNRELEGKDADDAAAAAAAEEEEEGEEDMLYGEGDEEQLEGSPDLEAAASDEESRPARLTQNVSLAPELPFGGGNLGGESQPLVRNMAPSEEHEDAAPHSSPERPDYGSLPDPSTSPSLHYVHRSLHALRARRRDPNLKGYTFDNPFHQQLCSPSFLLCLVWMSICIFWANFYIGTAVEQLYAKSGYDTALTRHYTTWFTLLLPSGILGIGAFGYLTSVLGFSATAAATSAFGVGFALCNLYGSLLWQPLTFVLYSFFRSFLFSCMFAYLAHEFGYRHFGLLSGIVLAVGGALGFAQYPLTQRLVVRDRGALRDGDGGGDGGEGNGGGGASLPSDYNAVNELQLYTLLCTFFFAAYVKIKQRMRAERVEEQIKQHTRHLQAVY